MRDPYRWWCVLVVAAMACARESTVPGSAGAQGPAGERGPAGVVGGVGPEGPTGPTGTPGEAGLPGTPGAVGPTGATGTIGDIGPTGATGAAGVPGLIWAGAWSSVANYAWSDVVSAGGSSYICIASNGCSGVAVSSAADWSLVSALGATGAVGATGLTGAAGRTGATGPTGAPGLPGAQGIQGIPGLVWSGTWDSVSPLPVNSAVSWQGSSFVCIAEGGCTGVAPSSATDWSLLAQEGVTGSTGSLGPTGAQGATGPTGSGLFVSGQSSANSYFAALFTCVTYWNASVTVIAPGAGTVFVTANAQMILFHTAGTSDEIQLAIGNASTDCGNSNVDMTWETPASFPSFAYNLQTFTVTRAFPVSAAGSYTFYLNGSKVSGGVAQGAQDNFNYAAIYATYFAQ